MINWSILSENKNDREESGKIAFCLHGLLLCRTVEGLQLKYMKGNLLNRHIW